MMHVAYYFNIIFSLSCPAYTIYSTFLKLHLVCICRMSPIPFKAEYHTQYVLTKYDSMVRKQKWPHNTLGSGPGNERRASISLQVRYNNGHWLLY